MNLKYIKYKIKLFTMSYNKINYKSNLKLQTIHECYILSDDFYDKKQACDIANQNRINAYNLYNNLKFELDIAFSLYNESIKNRCELSDTCKTIHKTFNAKIKLLNIEDEKYFAAIYAKKNAHIVLYKCNEYHYKTYEHYENINTDCEIAFNKFNISEKEFKKASKELIATYKYK